MYTPLFVAMTGDRVRVRDLPERRAFFSPRKDGSTVEGQVQETAGPSIIRKGNI